MRAKRFSRASERGAEFSHTVCTCQSVITQNIVRSLLTAVPVVEFVGCLLRRVRSGVSLLRGKLYIGYCFSEAFFFKYVDCSSFLVQSFQLISFWVLLQFFLTGRVIVSSNTVEVK